MKLAIMQPYFFPYIGYWQLIRAVDRFVIYDDVNYIKGGWVNRNRILINGQPNYITVPLQHASPHKHICDLSLDASTDWRNKMLKTIANVYRKAAGFDATFPVIEELIQHGADNLADYLAHQLQTLARSLGMQTEFVVTSRYYGNYGLCGQDRVLDICRHEGATIYINAQGGQSLYDAQTFAEHGIELDFLVMRPVPYRQRLVNTFVPYLSVIDALMEIGREGVQQQLEAFELIGTRGAYEL